METTLSFWFMTDSHTFIKPVGESLKDVVNDLKSIAKSNPYGMICPVIIIKDGKEMPDRIGKSCHVDKDGCVDTTKWEKAVAPLFKQS